MHGDKSESDERRYGPDGGYPEGFRILGVRNKFSGNAHCCARKCFRHRQWALPSPGFMESARFMQYMTAPGGDCFCFWDYPAVEAE